MKVPFDKLISYKPAQTKLILMMGLPCSGKTMFVKTHLCGYAVVNPDAVRLALYHTRYIQSAETVVWAITETMVKSLFIYGAHTVVLDSCSTSKKERDVWESNDLWEAYVLHMTVPKDICITRARSCTDEEKVDVINRMAAHYEYVQDDENEILI